MLGVLLRPWRRNEAWWAAGGAVALVLSGALTPHAEWAALARGLDVYLFLIGMMALAEFARVEGVFAWTARLAVRAAGGSRARLLLLVYAAGIATTALLSNDATIVVLTPAVLAALACTDASPDAYVFACALVANAASFAVADRQPVELVVLRRRDAAAGRLARIVRFGVDRIDRCDVRGAPADLRTRHGAHRSPRATAPRRRRGPWRS